MKRCVVILAVALVAGCGPSFEFPESRPGDYPPIKTVLLREGFTLAPGASTALDLRVPESGTLVATVDWTHASNQVIAVFSSQRCADVNLALAGGCKEYVRLTRPSVCPAKPRVLSADASQGAPVRLYVANTGLAAETGRVEITHCRDAPDCGQGAACGQCPDFGVDSCR